MTLDEIVRERLSYNPETGLLKRKATGKVAGTPTGHGYLCLRVKDTNLGIDKKLYAHRVAWLLHYGEWPIDEIDHVNGVRADNRLDNLRPANRAQQMGNQRKRSAATTSKLKGVYRHKKNNKWVANIRDAGKSKYLGSFDTEDEAHEAYMDAARIKFGEFARAS